jgi:zinc and cadmium transporter
VYLGTLQGEMIHNFADGLLIAAAFLSCSSSTGWTVTTAIIAHEVPQEVSDYFVYRAGGCTLAQALAFNFASALTAVLGGIVMLSISDSISASDLGFILLASAGFLLYTAVGGLLPGIYCTTCCVPCSAHTTAAAVNTATAAMTSTA